MNPLQWLFSLLPGHISCDEFDERLDAYVDGELSFTGRVRMAMHRLICTACAAYAAAYAKTVGLVKASIESGNDPTADESVSEDLVQDILNKRMQGGNR